jgi:hypothetical protein
VPPPLVPFGIGGAVVGPLLDELHDLPHDLGVLPGQIDLALAQQVDHLDTEFGQPHPRIGREGLLARGVGEQPFADLVRGHVDDLVELVPQKLDIRGGAVGHRPLSLIIGPGPEYAAFTRAPSPARAPSGDGRRWL